MTPASEDNQDDTCLCGSCTITVAWDDDGVCCNQCDIWYYITCQHMSKREYTKLGNSDETWLCSQCKPASAKPIPDKQDPPKGNNSWYKNTASMNIGTLNVTGLKTENISEAKKEHLAADMDNYRLQVLGIQETHLHTRELKPSKQPEVKPNIPSISQTIRTLRPRMWKEQE